MHRWDTLHSPRYDENRGAISASQAASAAGLATLIRPGGEVPDAACGTGRYWPALLAAGLRVTGADSSAGMPAYVTVEVPDGPLPAPAGPRQVPGEDSGGGEQGGCHCYPARDQARSWLTAAGFGVRDEQDADGYWHFLLERR